MKDKCLKTVALLHVFVLSCLSLVAHTDLKSSFVLEEDEPVALQGEWNLVLDSFLSYDEVLRDTTAITITVPGTWNNLEWKGEKFSGKGFGTYYQNIRIPENSNLKSLAIYIPDISLAYKIYANNKLLGGVGQLGDTKETNVPQIKPTIYDIDVPNDTIVTILIHAANFRHHNSGMWIPPVIGSEDDIRRENSRRNYISFLALGGILMIALYHLYLFIRRRKEDNGIYFFFICICLIANTMTKRDLPILAILPDLSWVVMKKIQYISLYGLAWLNVEFIRKLYPDLVPKLLTQSLGIVTAIGVLFALVVSPSLGFALVIPFQLITVSSAIFIIYVLIKAVSQQLTSAQLLLIGMTITFLTLVNDVLIVHFVVHTIPLAHFGVFAYVITFSMAIANRFTTSLRHEESLTKRLETVNQELEEKVHVRTAELEWQKRIVDKQNQELKEVNEEQKQLMAIVAHDLKSPLNKISGIAQVLKMQVSGELAGMNDMIEKVADEGRQIIENLNHLWSYEKEEFEAKKEKFELDYFMTNLLEEFHQEAQAKSLEFQTSLGCETKKINSDKNLLGRILDNLISNAIKFSSPKNKIWISTEVDNKYFKIIVKDEGPGFTRDDMKKVFGKFQKLSARPTANESSTGLGLSIVKTLSEKLEGDIVLNSRKGKGAEFTLSLPVKTNGK